MTPGEYIKKCRLDRSLTQEKLAQLLGVQKSIISKYERGDVVNIKRDTIKKLAQIFEVDEAGFLVGTSSSAKGRPLVGTLLEEAKTASDDALRIAIEVLRGQKALEKKQAH